MRATTIARNYAEALLVLARKANDLDGWGIAVNGIVMAMEGDARLRNFLAAPQISAAQKNVVLGKAFTAVVASPNAKPDSSISNCTLRCLSYRLITDEPPANSILATRSSITGPFVPI